MEADLVVLDMKSTPLIDFRMRHVNSLEEALFMQMTLATIARCGRRMRRGAGSTRAIVPTPPRLFGDVRQPCVEANGGVEPHSIARAILSGVSGRSRARTPSALKSALASAAAVGPAAHSPVPSAGCSGRLRIETSISGVSSKRRIG